MLDGSCDHGGEVAVEAGGAARLDSPRPVREDCLTLRDGRALSYAEFGDPQGRPVLYCHGFPGSRLEAALAHHAAVDAKVRILSFDRPGYGLSDFRPGRTILDWADDVEDAATQLRLERFAVLGVSGGAPYALACAHAIPHRLTVAGIVCGLAPTQEPHLRRAMTRVLRTGLFLGRNMPRLFALLYAALVAPLPRWSPRSVAWLLSVSPSRADRASMRGGVLKPAIIASVREAFRYGARAAIRDVELYTQPWGFDAEAIVTPVRLWHGEADPTVPVEMGRYLAQRLPNCLARFVPGEGHFSLPVNYAGEILRTLAAPAAPFDVRCQAGRS